jgi:hypothetical protein
LKGFCGTYNLTWTPSEEEQKVVIANWRIPLQDAGRAVKLLANELDRCGTIFAQRPEEEAGMAVKPAEVRQIDLTSVLSAEASEESPVSDVNVERQMSASTPQARIDDYLAAHPEIVNHEALAERIGISRDTLFAIKGEARWVRPIAYQSTAALIGCSEQDLHPHAVTRKRRKGKSNQKSDAKSDG